MEPDVVEIAPPFVASSSRTRKPKKAVIHEVIDVEQYEFRNLVDKKNKGKAIQVSPFIDHNPFTHLNNDVIDDVDVEDYAMLQALLNSKNVPTNVEIDMATTQQWGLKSTNVVPSLEFCSNFALPPNNKAIYSSAMSPDLVMMPGPSKYDASASSSRSKATKVLTLPQEKFLRDFKRFDTVDKDFSDHQYASYGKASKQHSKSWVKKIQADWQILENDLPETIFVRACESRMDLLRAVIIGPEGTPYHDGLFFFDIQFPDTYPSVPPKVHYHSGGLRINPNLYNCGKVCLSLLGTWSGNAREKWIPKESTMLQLLVSIQALILNQNPYFNEPGYENYKGTKSGESHSKAYSENVFILSLKTMVYSMKKPPMHFEEFVRSHYFVRAHDIVKACKAYKDGAPLGSMVKGVQDVEESSESGSKKFKAEVANYMKTVVDEFVKLGVKELEDKPKPPLESESNLKTNKRSLKRNRSSSIKEFVANFVGRCVFQ